MEVTPAIREHATEKLGKLQRHADNINSVHVTFDVEKQDQIAIATVHIPCAEINARSSSENLYKAIQLMIDKLIVQLDKHKGKIISSHRGNGHHEDLVEEDS
jgi:putative sigma-54 modulation protein